MPPKQYKLEEALQSDIVRTFSELYPERRGQLFHVPNQRNHKLQAFKARSIGIFPGVSDLIYYESNGVGEIMVKGIEVKLPNSTHKVDHVEQQLEWAKIFESKGGEWRICTSVNGAIDFIECCINRENLTVKDVEFILKNNKRKKTIKF